MFYLAEAAAPFVLIVGVGCHAHDAADFYPRVINYEF
jgi:hypothetical protein